MDVVGGFAFVTDDGVREVISRCGQKGGAAFADGRLVLGVGRWHGGFVHRYKTRRDQGRALRRRN